jgi:NADP-dependent 3-hydroxy acid dehydrogenase YdfG
MTLGQWRHVMATDLDGAFACLQRAARRMVAGGTGGRLIAVTSVHEHQPRVGSAAYDAAKHGLGGLIKTLALELGQYAITANCVAPGEIATPMTGQEDQDPHARHRPGVPLGWPSDAREIAAVIAFLASAQASYVTGASWPVDGGMLQMGPQAGSHVITDERRTRNPGEAASPRRSRRPASLASCRRSRLVDMVARVLEPHRPPGGPDIARPAHPPRILTGHQPERPRASVAI